MKFAWFFSILLTIFLLFQNCAVYKSPGLNQFEQAISGQSTGATCRYISTSDVASSNNCLFNCSGALISTYANSIIAPSGQVTSDQCFFANSNSGVFFPQIACDVSQNDSTIANASSSFATCNSGGGTTTSCQTIFAGYFGGLGSTAGEQFDMYVVDPQAGSSTESYASFKGNSFGIEYTVQDSANTSGGGTDYYVRYFAAQGGVAPSAWGASCSVLIPNGMALSSDQLKALAKITEEMAYNASLSHASF